MLWHMQLGHMSKKGISYLGYISWRVQDMHSQSLQVLCVWKTSKDTIQNCFSYF